MLRWTLLAAITAVAAGLRLVHLGDVPGNPFYDAAVHTMAGSWHAFIFGALDPSGGVSVDKPPVDLWAQVASVKLFGYNPTALKLPQALAGTASVVVLWDLVRRAFGWTAGLAAAAALAVLPVAVLTARSDTMDTFMSLLVLAAVWFAARAVERRRGAWLLAAGAAVGLAFNVKLFEALVVVPALGLVWLVGSRGMPRRVLTALAATLVAIVVGMAWIVPVALTPASARPYPIGSTNGSIWNLVFVFNGLDRLHGRPLTTPDTLPAGSSPSAAIVHSQQQRARFLHLNTGPKRLFGKRFAAIIGSELLPAMALIAAMAALAVVLLVQRRRANGGGPTRASWAIGAGLAFWALSGAVLFSAMKSFHPRYFETVSPAVAGVLGFGVCVLTLRAGRLGRLAAAAVVAATGAYAAWAGTSAGHAELIACIGAALLLAATAAPRRVAPAALVAASALGVAALLVVPTAQSASIVHTRSFDAERSGAMPPGWPPLLNRYLSAHRHGTRYSFGSIAPAKAAPLIADHPQPVLMLTSYRSRPLLSVPQLAHLVRAGEVRYFVIGRRCTSALTRHTAACPATAHWVMAHSTDVTSAAGIGPRRLLYRIDFCRALSPPAPAPARARGHGRSAGPSGRSGSGRSASRASQARCVQPRRA